MRFVCIAVIAADAVSHHLGAEQARRFDNRALAIDPLGLNRVQPGTLDWRQHTRMRMLCPCRLTT